MSILEQIKDKVLRFFSNGPKFLQDLATIINLKSDIPLNLNYITTITVDEIDKLKIGDHIFVTNSSDYSHHGIYAGDNIVWHYDGNNVLNPVIKKSTIKYFMGNSTKINIMIYIPDFSEEQIISRAQSRAGEKEYDNKRNNCMQYAYWCRIKSEDDINDLQLFFKQLQKRLIENLKNSSTID